VDLLAATECPALTARRARRAERSGAPADPIVWSEAEGCNVLDVDGNRYVDLTAGFGAAAIGHRHPRVVTAVREQAGRLIHGLGDLHPSDVKIRLLERLGELAPWPGARVMLGLSGSDAIEAALKTAVLATGRPGVLAFEGGYHGLAHGPLAACGYREGMRSPFSNQLNPHVAFAPWPAAEQDCSDAVKAVRRAWDEAQAPVGAVLVEPVQGRGGARIPPPGFLAELEALCRQRGALLVADEIMTGLGRCARHWLSVEQGAKPDLICAGKGLGGGLPVSACLGPAEVMGSWGSPDGEAIHTGTFFGHPIGCEAALATLDVLESEDLAARAHEKGQVLIDKLRTLQPRHDCLRQVRGVGLLAGVELDSGARVLSVVRGLLERGYLALPAGVHTEVVQLCPPLTIDPSLFDGFTDALDEALRSA
jgi:4-aminobutyrate aminotransferase/(S)-3-amino-2-methylpropionate transaminase